MIIAFCGQKNNGKDTAGEIIIELAKSEGIRLKRIAFADSMKQIAAKSLGYDDLDQKYCTIGSEIEFMNDIKDRDIEIEYSYSTPYYPSDLTNHHIGIKPISGREFLINLGESIKEHLGRDFWAHLAFSNIAPWPDIVVTDLRFEEEAEYLRNIGAWIIHICNDPNQEDGQLPGEQKLPEHYIDYYLDNTGSKEDLKKNLRTILTDIIRLEETYIDDYDIEPEHSNETDEWS